MREELSRKVVFRNGRVVLREVVALKTEWTNPDLGYVVDNGKRVQDSTAHSAAKGGVRENRHIRNGFERSIN